MGAATWSAHALPGNPGIPGPTDQIYYENFENRTFVSNVESLSTYRGGIAALNSRYTAHPYWLDTTNCNGQVFMAENDLAMCNSLGNGILRSQATAMGRFHGRPANQLRKESVLGSYTQTLLGQANLVEFETVQGIPLTAGRFVAFSVDAANYWTCEAPARYNFFLVNGASEIPLNSAPLSPCDPPNTHYVGEAIVKRMTATLIVPSTANMRLRVRNLNWVSQGNDAIFDDFRLLDATPQLDKQFERGTLANDAHGVNASVRMIFTITNRQDLLVKTGWGFVETLPNGLQFAANPNIAHTCAAATTNISGNRLTVSNGSLAAGAASCTISVDVTSTTAGTYTNQPSNISSLIGLDPPASATVTFINNVTLRVQKVFSDGRAYPNDQMRLQVFAPAGGGTSVAVTTTGATNNPPEVATFTNAVPGLEYRLQENIAAGSTSNGSEYDYSYSCTNARPGGQTPSGANWSFVVTPAPGDDLTCTFTNTARHPTIRLRKALTNGRIWPTDQFALSIAPAAGAATTVTTTGQDGAIAGEAVIGPAAAGTVYTLSEAMAPGSGGQMSHYNTSYTCTNARAGGQAPSGSGSSFQITPAAGDDLSCTFTTAARQPIVRLQKELPSGRVAPADQFALSITPASGTGSSVTTSGAGTTATGQAVVNPAVVNMLYTFTEAMAPGSGAQLSNYTASYNCVNALPGGQQGTNNDSTFQITVVPGDDITCTLRNVAAPNADLSIVKSANPTTARTGDVVTYTLTVSNAGPSAANNAVLRDTPGAGLDCNAAGLPAPTCSASGGASCPGGVTAGGLTSTAGVAIPVLPAGGGVVVTMRCAVTASGLP
jgi:uncharacterized repeat protein (TIGR01451 family)